MTKKRDEKSERVINRVQRFFSSLYVFILSVFRTKIGIYNWFDYTIYKTSQNLLVSHWVAVVLLSFGYCAKHS